MLYSYILCHIPAFSTSGIENSWQHPEKYVTSLIVLESPPSVRKALIKSAGSAASLDELGSHDRVGCQRSLPEDPKLSKQKIEKYIKNDNDKHIFFDVILA